MNHPELTVKFEVGKRQNVRVSDVETYGEMVREVTATQWHKERDGLWFSWFWKPEMGPDLAGSMDCGFAGMRILEPDGTPTETHRHFIKGAA